MINNSNNNNKNPVSLLYLKHANSNGVSSTWKSLFA